MWLKRFFMVYLLALLFVAMPGSLLAEQTDPTYGSLLADLTEIWKKQNNLSVISELDLITIQKNFPEILERLEKLETDLQNFKMNMESFNLNLGLTYSASDLHEKNLSQSLAGLTQLNTMFQELSLSIETLRTSFTSIENSAKRAETKSNIGLVISIAAGIIGASLALYTISSK